VLESALLDTNVPGNFDLDCRCLTAPSTVIVQLMMVLTTLRSTDFISVCRVHVCQKRNVPLHRGTHPVAILESKNVKTDVQYPTVDLSFHPTLRFDAGRLRLCLSSAVSGDNHIL